jgi:hypothetical protein
VNLLAAARDALFGDEGIEDHQQIEIESSEVHAFRPTRARLLAYQTTFD